MFCKDILLDVILIWKRKHSNEVDTFPIGTSLVPAGTRIFARNPSSGVSNPIVALSVSISASRSPSISCSPSFFVQRKMVPRSIVGDSAGNEMTTCCGKASAVNTDRYDSRSADQTKHHANMRTFYFQKSPAVDYYAQPVDIILQCRVTG